MEMDPMNTSSKLGAAMLMSSVLGCSGSEATSSSALSGTFLDSPVSGLDFKTESTHGTTDAAGKFSYRAGEMVSFAIGELQLGAAAGADVLTPLSVTSGASKPSDP